MKELPVRKLAWVILHGWGALVVVATPACATAQRQPADPPATVTAVPPSGSVGNQSSATRSASASAKLEADGAYSPARIAERAAKSVLTPASETTVAVALPHFFQALRALEAKRRTHPVRIAWLGDSHTAADFWTDEVRAQLQARFGVGGPGFFHIALKGYRHSGLRFEQSGGWGREPIPPALRSRSGDGTFGLGGIRTWARSAGATFEARPEPGATQGRANWKVRVRLAKQEVVTLVAAGQSFTLKGGQSQDVIEQALPAEGDASLRVRIVQGTPRFLGAVLEAAEGGVVLDTLGIDGARVETPLAWDEHQWQRELAAREVRLVVLAYGTNEVFDQRSPAAYAEHYRLLIGRVRAVAPEADCLILGVPDALDPQGRPHARVSEIANVQATAAEQLGCGFFGVAEAMAREGGFLGWLAASPKLAKPDGIHLTIAGYQLLGARTAAAILAGYDRETAH